MDETGPDSALILEELRRVCGAVDGTQLSAFARAIDDTAGAIFVTGRGRSGLVGRMFAMRLMQLGKLCHIAGDTLAPAFGAQDMLIAISDSGRTETTLLHARQAREVGGRVIAVTGTPQSAFAQAACAVVTIPGSESAQFGGSLFEQACLIIFDAIAHALATGAGPQFDRMAGRHANLQ